MPWGQKALGGYLGDDRAAWRRHDAVALIEDGARVAELLVDIGDADPFLEKELRPELLEQACADAGIPLTLRRQPGYDHSYYFISTFMADHLRWHAERLSDDRTWYAQALALGAAAWRSGLLVGHRARLQAARRQARGTRVAGVRTFTLLGLRPASPAWSATRPAVRRRRRSSPPLPLSRASPMPAAPGSTRRMRRARSRPLATLASAFLAGSGNPSAWRSPARRW